MKTIVICLVITLIAPCTFAYGECGWVTKSMREMAELRLEQAREERRIAQANAADREECKFPPDWRELVNRPLDPNLPTFDEVSQYFGRMQNPTPNVMPQQMPLSAMPSSEQIIMEMQQIEMFLNQYGAQLAQFNPQLLQQCQFRFQQLQMLLWNVVLGR